MTMPEPTYFIHSMSRSPHTRHIRRTLPSPQSSTKNLYIGGTIRVVRGRPYPVSASFLRAHISEVTDKQAKGLIKVLDNRSQLVDLKQFVPVATSAPTPEAPSPPQEPEEVIVVAEDSPEPEEAEVPPVTIEEAPNMPAQEAPTRPDINNPFFSRKKRK